MKSCGALSTCVFFLHFCIHGAFSYDQFPLGFKFGAASSAYQIEGAWNVSDKAPNIWDTFTHEKPHAIRDGSNGDVACDSYHLWRRDVEMASELGLDFYRFSISWSRILPSGFPNHISEDAKNYYNNLINGLLEAGIEPVVTMYHWDLPQSLQDLGGWTNPLISEWFAAYARVLYTLYADRVKTWITLNEPVGICEITYTEGYFAPGIISSGVGNFICTKNVLLAHAKAWRIYDKEFKPKYHGKVSIVNIVLWFHPAQGEDETTAELARQLFGGLYSHPIYSKKGGWPPLIEDAIAKNSKREGYPQSRLPAFTTEEVKLIRGTYDFYGLNYYISLLVRKARKGEKVGLWPHSGTSELNISLVPDPQRKKAPPVWFYTSAPGIRRALKWLKREYGDIEVIIMENGYGNQDPELEDVHRVEFFKEHLEQVLLSIYKDGVNVTGFTVWSLMDSYEWKDGYRSKFGLYAVDFQDPQRTRTPRSSALYYKHVIQKNSIDVNPELYLYP